MNLNPKEVKEKYPKSVEKLKQYLTKGYEQEKVPKELQAQINPDILTTYTIVGVRGLYEFFDESELYIHVIRSGEDLFSYGIGFGFFSSGRFETRLEAEKHAFETAFEELEKRLNNE